MQAQVTSEDVKKYEESRINKQERTVEFIKSLVCKKHGYEDTEILSQKTRKADSKDLRYICMYLLCKNTTLGIQKIGKIFGKHHATVVHAKKQIEG